MARTSNITFGQVAAIADAMKAAGTRPTARAVRERIGSGSMGTIHKLLQQWQGKGNETDEDSEPAELPAHIQNALMDFIGTEIATACEPLNMELEAAKEAAEDIALDNERLHSAFDMLMIDLDRTREERAAAMAQLNLTRDTLAASDTERDELRSRITELLRDLDRSQRQTEMMASYATDLDKARTALTQSERFRINAEKAVAVISAQLTAEIDKTCELKERTGNAIATAAAREAELKQANIQYQTCAARLESAAREIESLRKPKATPKVATPKPAKKATNGNT